MNDKVEKFIEILLLIYQVPNKKIAIEFFQNMPKFFEEKLA